MKNPKTAEFKAALLGCESRGEMGNVLSGREILAIIRDLEWTEARVDTLEATVKAATSFALGRDGDDDPRPFVLVARAYPIPPWTVIDVEPVLGVIVATERRFDDQAEALEYGWARLREMRR